MVLETKAVVPPIATLGLGTLAAAVHRVAESFGVWTLSTSQEAAVAALGLAVLPLVNFLLAYLLPHTSRPDLQAP